MVSKFLYPHKACGKLSFSLLDATCSGGSPTSRHLAKIDPTSSSTASVKNRRTKRMAAPGTDDDADEHGIGIGIGSSRRLVQSWKAAVIVLAAVSMVAMGVGFCFTESSSSSKTSVVAGALLGRRRDAESIAALACHATRFPDVCASSTGSDPRSKGASSQQLIQISIDIASRVSSQSLNLTRGIFDRSAGNKNLTAASRDCVQVLGFAGRRFEQCKASLSSNFSSRAVKDVQALLSAALSYQYDCFSALGYVNSSTEVQQTMLQVQTGIPLISNALSMADAFDLYGPNPANWKPPPSKRAAATDASASGVEWLSRRDRHLLQHGKKKKKGFRFSAVVAQDGSSEFKSVQQVIDSAPSKSSQRYTIHVKQGVYNEQVYVPETKTMIMLVGDGVNKTIITGSQYVQEGVTTMETATMTIAGDGFLARDLTIQNTAGPDRHQAVALRIDADQVAFQSCSLLGFQDTLYSHTLRHFFSDCTIAGTVDFIFGNAATVFQSCKLLIRPGRKGIYTSMVTAHGRIDPAQTTGFAFHNCSVDASSDYLPLFQSNPSKYKTYLGRPWKLYSRAVFLDSYLDAIVAAEGWLAWSGDFALDTLFFGEYRSGGPGGADVSKRVPWSTQLKDSDAAAYSAQSFIQGDQWIPS